VQKFSKQVAAVGTYRNLHGLVSLHPVNKDAVHLRVIFYIKVYLKVLFIILVGTHNNL
jgi:hypothetical protein